jgi:hypothetical protein
VAVVDREIGLKRLDDALPIIGAVAEVADQDTLPSHGPGSTSTTVAVLVGVICPLTNLWPARSVLMICARFWMSGDALTAVPAVSAMNWHSAMPSGMQARSG